MVSTVGFPNQSIEVWKDDSLTPKKTSGNEVPDYSTLQKPAMWRRLQENWWLAWDVVPSGQHTKSYRKSPFLIGKPSISMGNFQ
jgi:hypothetical protein